MKQPELGKKILELRKEKGWTQEELVEKCNLNVRTIQRIEAGNVTPRSFTIKALFHALDYRYEESESEFLQENQKDLAYLYVAFACGFIYFFLVFFEINLDFNWLESEEKVDSKTLLVFKTATFLMYTGFILGWLKCEFFLPNQFSK